MPHQFHSCLNSEYRDKNFNETCNCIRNRSGITLVSSKKGYVSHKQQSNVVTPLVTPCYNRFTPLNQCTESSPSAISPRVPNYNNKSHHSPTNKQKDKFANTIKCDQTNPLRVFAAQRLRPRENVRFLAICNQKDFQSSYGPSSDNSRKTLPTKSLQTTIKFLLP